MSAKSFERWSVKVWGKGGMVVGKRILSRTCIFGGLLPSLKTNMPMENPPSEDVFPIEHGDLPFQFPIERSSIRDMDLTRDYEPIMKLLFLRREIG